MPKPKRKRITKQERQRREKISTGVKRYWREVKRVSTETKLPVTKLRAKFKKLRSFSSIGTNRMLKKLPVRAGRGKVTNLFLEIKDTKGKTYITSISGSMGKNSKELKKLLRKNIGYQLASLGLYLKKYRNKFKRSNFRMVKSIKVFTTTEKLYTGGEL